MELNLFVLQLKLEAIDIVDMNELDWALAQS